ncbi:unnamed protein product [Clonostachys chloroleuca]|uniref:NmrA-like domain-containing protein n=1 Tax=Clonostachys chloroleuca TaxID=1926264 RepID=A0AA35QDM9_9HYPO|nr:unnamed protein product [Clonostachys chloroleuca]
MSVITVLGATGIQGGSVVRKLTQNPSWRVRAITRNPEGENAKELQSQDIEVAQGDLDDVESLKTAFMGSTAIFSVTNFWQNVPIHPSLLKENGEKEYQQMLNIGKAAFEIPTLKHLVVSSLTGPQKISGGKYHVPHMDYKARAVEEIETRFPTLAAKITILWVGWYPTNLTIPLLRPFLWPATGKYVWLMPSKPSGKLPIAGDESHNVGIVVERILECPSQTMDKIVGLAVEYLDHTEVLKVWEKVTGNEAIYIELTGEAAAGLIGVAAIDLEVHLRFSEEYPDVGTYERGRFVKPTDIGLGEELIGLEGTLRSYSDSLL